MKKRFLAILLCLSVLLMACACAAETMEPPAVSETESQAPAPQLTLSEVNAESSKTEEPATPSETAPAESEPQETISMEESDIELEPIQPIVPEEKETTLEKVLSFDIGIDGMIAYDFLFYDEPSTAQICLSGEAYADGNGVFYHTDGSAIVRVNDGARFPFISYSQVFDIEICGDDFYILKAGKTGLYSILYHYDISTGFETPTLKATYDNLPSGSLGFVGGVPVVLEQGKVYSVDGKLLDASKTPFVMEQWEKDSVSVQMQGDALSILQGENFYSYVNILSDSITVVAERKKRVDDTIYASYDQNGNVRTRFLYDRQYDKPWASCAVDFEHAGERYTATVYCPYDAVLGDQTFEDLLDGWVFFDAYGNAYYAAYYLDHCDIWSIDQGYSDVRLPGEDAEIKAEDGSVAPTSSASGSSASSVQWVDVTREQARTNAKAMIDCKWYIAQGNLFQRTNTELPTYLVGKSIGAEETGIPYCKGGNYGEQEFLQKQPVVVSNGNCRMTGNIKEVDGHQPRTLGLDCARFVGQALEFTHEDGYSPEQFLALGYGHEVESVADLDEMDLIISIDHAMFFCKIEDEKVHVYDTSSKAEEEKTNERETIFTVDTLDNYSYRNDENELVVYYYFHIYSASGQTPTHHWVGCERCEGYRTSEEHTWEYTSISDTQHTKTCTECGYSVTESHGGPCIAISPTQHVNPCMACGYSVTADHTFTYTYTSGGHTATCTGCGYSVSAMHSLTAAGYNLLQHTRACSCGYSVTEAHTLRYHYDADGHWRECSVCSFETASLAHNFVDSECTVCGCPQFIIMDIIAIPEEDEPLPVPEDQKATL